MFSSRLFLFHSRLAFIILILGLSGCSEYWWTRGQPPDVQTLLKRSRVTLDEALKRYGETRAELVPIALALRDSLDTALERISNGREVDLTEARVAFEALEGKLSVGSRAPYGQLAGQLRTFSLKEAEEGFTAQALGLFASRTYFFLANELSVPAPVVG